MLKISLSSLPRRPSLQVTPPTAMCLWAAPSFAGTSIACMVASNYNRSKDTQIPENTVVPQGRTRTGLALRQQAGEKEVRYRLSGTDHS